MMVANSHFDLMHGRLPKFEDLFADENFVEPLDFDFLVSAINAIPLHKRLGIKQETLSELELENIETDASNFLKGFNEKLTIKCSKGDFNSCKVLLDPNETESEFTEKRKANLRPKEETAPVANEKIEEESDETFLKYLYDPKGNNLLIPDLQKNLNFNLYTLPRRQDPGKSLGLMSFEDLERLISEINVGKFDQYARCRTTTSFTSSDESEEELSYRTEHLSSRLDFTPSETHKFSFLKKISDDSKKIYGGEMMDKEKTNFHPVNWLTSDDESENNGTMERRNAGEPTKRRHKRSLKNESESRPSGKQSNTNQGPASNKNKSQNRRKLNKTGNNSSKPQPGNTQAQSSSTSNDSIANNLPRECAIKPGTASKNPVRGKGNQKLKRHSLNAGSSFALPSCEQLRALCELDTPEPTSELQTVQQKDLGNGQGKGVRIGPLNAQVMTTASSSKIVETKDQKQISNEIKSSHTAPSQCKNTKDGKNNHYQSTDSSDEDWANRAQQNLSVVDRLLHQAPKP